MNINTHQAGFSMLEILITVFVLAVGLLGVAGMQATSIKLSHESHLRSQASLLAYDIADRMRANSTEAMANNYDGNFTGNSNFDGNCSNPTGNACNAAAIRAVDLNNWDFKLGQTFPGVQANILTTVTQGQSIATIRLVWVDTDTDDAANLNDIAPGTTRLFTLRTTII